MYFIIDIILVLIFAICIFVSAKKGFILAISDIVSVFAGIIGAKYLSEIVAPKIYSEFFSQNVSVYIKTLFTQGVLAPENIKEKFMSVFSFLPENIYDTISSSSLFSADKFDVANVVDAVTLESKIIAPFLTSICRAVVYVVFMIVIIIVIRIVAAFICKALLPKRIKDVNKTLGGILGAVKGLLIVVVCANGLDLISLLNKSLNSLVVQSYICSFVREHLSIASLFIK